MKIVPLLAMAVIVLAEVALAAGLRPVARGENTEASVVRPVARSVVAPLRPVLRPVEAAAVAPLVRVSISTMSAPPVRRPEAIAGLPLLGTERVQATLLPFLPPVLPLREQVEPAVLTIAPVRPEMRQAVVVSAPLRPAVRPQRAAEPALLLDPDEPFLVGQEAGGDLRPQFSIYAVALSLRPMDRPEGITRAAMALEAERRRGSLCGDLALQGVTRGSVPGRGACGIEDAVEVRSVAGVRLTTPAVIDCRTATRLRQWVENAAIPAFRDVGGGLAQIEIMGAYSCRTRNNVAGARLSEHSFGRALDIGGFRLQDGTRVTVLRGWNSDWGQRLRRLHQAACGPFGTVLGPNANAAHRDHFHFDTARYRSGSYCR